MCAVDLSLHQRSGSDEENLGEPACGGGHPRSPFLRCLNERSTTLLGSHWCEPGHSWLARAIHALGSHEHVAVVKELVCEPLTSHSPNAPTRSPSGHAASGKSQAPPRRYFVSPQVHVTFALHAVPRPLPPTWTWGAVHVPESGAATSKGAETSDGGDASTMGIDASSKRPPPAISLRAPQAKTESASRADATGTFTSGGWPLSREPSRELGGVWTFDYRASIFALRTHALPAPW